MDLGERILVLRKSKGISQEELADKIGVSRQAVSKWESNQSIPDIEKIIILSEYFNVTTDYILTGKESSIKGLSDKELVNNEYDKYEKKKDYFSIYAIIATLINFLANVLSFTLWNTYRNELISGFGIIMLAIGCSILAIGYKLSNERKDVYKYLMINCWLVILIPFSLFANFALAFIEGYTPWMAPYIKVGNSLILFGLSWIVYSLICLSLCIGIYFFKVKKINH